MCGISGHASIVATTAAGIEAARELDELYRSHAAEVFRYAYAVLGNRADAEDVTQTTFINALRALERGERPHTPKNWLITIAHNLIRQRFRQQQSRPRHVELDEQLPAAEAADDDGPSLDDLVSALQRIPPTQREALVLRELEGRSYIEIAELLGISQSALETLIFRARRSLAEELENLVTCAAAELALSRATDGRLGRKERRRLRAHLDECASCARTATRSLKYRRAFKTLAVLPLPFSLTLFKGAPTASAAVGLPTIGAGAAAGTAAGVGAAGVTTKIAVGLAAVAVAGGAGYEGVKAVQKPTTQAPPPANVVHAPIPRASEPTLTSLSRTPAAKPERVVAKPSRAKPATSATRERGRSATAPGHVKPKPEKNAKAMPARSPRADGGAKEKGSMAAPPAVEADRGKSAAAPARARVQATPKPVKPANPVKPVESAKAPKSARAAKPKPEKAPQAQAAKAQQAAKPQKAKGAEQPQQASAEQARPPKS
jgi:RNA polymerase sigma factor (sigma-70 family)